MSTEADNRETDPVCQTGAGLVLFFEFLLPIWNECIGPCHTYVWGRSWCILGFIFTLSDHPLIP